MAQAVKTPFDATAAAKSLREFDPILANYRRPKLWSNCWQLVSTLILFGVCWTTMYRCLAISFWFTLLFAVPTSLLLVRLFILQHDCGHRSFVSSKRANDVVDSALGLLTFTPYDYLRRKHAMHHACSGDLDRRGKSGEISTMTVEEYLNASPWQRVCYRVNRLPKVLQWCTANIGLHHIHHLDARILNCRWQHCYDAHRELQQAHEFSLRDSIGCLHVKRWDEDRQKMVGIDVIQQASVIPKPNP